MKKTLEVLGVIFGVLSVVSFVQRAFDISAWNLFKEIIEYYRAAAYSVLDLPARIFGLHFPSALKDFWTLSFVGASAYARTPNIQGSRFFRRYPNLTDWKYWKVLVVILGGLSGLGVAVLMSALSPMTYADEFHEEPMVLARGAAWNAIRILAGAILFFVLNAFAPSVT